MLHLISYFEILTLKIYGVPITVWPLKKKKLILQGINKVTYHHLLLLPRGERRSMAQKARHPLRTNFWPSSQPNQSVVSYADEKFVNVTNMQT